MILVTGGASYIGSHTVISLLNAGHQIVVVDNLCNSSKQSLARIERLTGKSVVFVTADVTCSQSMDKLFEYYSIDAVIHIGGLKTVGESIDKPLLYYRNNVCGTLLCCKRWSVPG